MIPLASMLIILGYRPEDDSWNSDGRRTYSNDDDATRAYLTTLTNILGRQGWDRDRSTLRTYRHSCGEIIEIEPSGPDCSGHYLHHMKAETVDGH